MRAPRRNHFGPLSAQPAVGPVAAAAAAVAVATVAVATVAAAAAAAKKKKKKFIVKIIENFLSLFLIWRGYKKWKNHEFFCTIFEECHKKEVDQISKQNMKISKG